MSRLEVLAQFSLDYRRIVVSGSLIKNQHPSKTCEWFLSAKRSHFPCLWQKGHSTFHWHLPPGFFSPYSQLHPGPSHLFLYPKLPGLLQFMGFPPLQLCILLRTAWFFYLWFPGHVQSASFSFYPEFFQMPPDVLTLLFTIETFHQSLTVIFVVPLLRPLTYNGEEGKSTLESV